MKGSNMLPLISSFPLRILIVTSVLIGLVCLFLIVDLRPSLPTQQPPQQVSARQPAQSLLPDLASQKSTARTVNQSGSNQPRQNFIDAYGKLPMSFEVNEGQTDKRVKFLSRGAGYSILLTTTEVVLALNKHPLNVEKESITEQIPTPQAKNQKQNAAEINKEALFRDFLRMKLVGA